MYVVGRTLSTMMHRSAPTDWTLTEVREAAQAFWRCAVDLYTGGRYEERTWPAKQFHLVVQEFDTRDRAIL